MQHFAHEMLDQFGALAAWWGHWNIFAATDLCLLGFAYCLWRTRNKARFSRIAAASVAATFLLSLAAGASVTNQVMADVQRMDVQAQAQSEPPAYHEGWWYATSSTAGPQWTQAFQAEIDCQAFVEFSRGAQFTCHRLGLP